MLRRIEVGKVFTPTTPVDETDLFSGRREQLERVIEAVAQRGQHAIIYGERGVGKTSLANVLGQFLRSEAAVLGPRATADSNDDYSSLWRKVFSEIAITEAKGQIGFMEQQTLFHETIADRLPESITPDLVRRTLNSLGTGRLLIVIMDEFDRLPRAVTTGIADTIKALSDHAVPVTLILVGVADSVGDLIEEHASVERALVQIPMPRMSAAEIEEIVTRGITRLSLNIERAALDRIVLLAQGLPHYAHLLGLHAALTVFDDQEVDTVGPSHVEAAVLKGVDHAQMSIQTAYTRATSSPRAEHLYAHVLLACALTPTDDLGYFPPSAVREPMSVLMGKRYDIPSFAKHLYDFTNEERGPVLERAGSERKYRYRFKNPLLQPYVLMRGLADGLLDGSKLQKLKAGGSKDTDSRR